MAWALAELGHTYIPEMWDAMSERLMSAKHTEDERRGRVDDTTGDCLSERVNERVWDGEGWV